MGSSQQDDHTLLALMAEDNQLAFQELYNRYWKELYQYVYNHLHLKEESEEIVQEIFYMLWSKRHTLEIRTSLPQFLFGSVKNSLLNTLRAQKVRRSYAADYSLFILHEADRSNESFQNLRDMEQVIEKSLVELPEKCQLIFKLSRREHLSIASIAERMGLSPKTVTNLLSMTLNHLRGSLGEFISVVGLLVAFGNQ